MSSFRLSVRFDPQGVDETGPMRPPPVPDRFQRRLRRISRFRAGVAGTRSAPPPRLSMAPALLAAIVVGLAVALAVWRLYGLRH